jgi:dihydropteroate synthase
MAVINRTPDSFYDRGATYELGAALAAADRAVAAGADILDIGGVRAGPGDEVTVAEEIRRVVPVVAALRDRHPGTVLSVDTWRAPVGAAAAAAGADLLNDAWGGADPDLAHVAAGHGLGLVCAHTGGAVPRTRPHRPGYPDLTGAVIAALTAKAERAA